MKEALAHLSEERKVVNFGFLGGQSVTRRMTRPSKS